MVQSPPTKVPVLYTMGKVGSSAIGTALQEAGLHYYAVHSLDPANLVTLARRKLDNNEMLPPTVADAMSRRGLILNRAASFYVSAVREPVARNLSAFFQNISLFFPGYSTASPEELLACFVDRYPHNVPISWFDREFRRFLGIDVFSVPFDKKERFAVNSTLILLRNDCSNHTKGAVLSQVFNQPISVSFTHGSDQSPYAKQYEAVKRIARFTPEFLDSLYNTPYAKHFWLPEELASFRLGWLEGSVETPLWSAA